MKLSPILVTGTMICSLFCTGCGGSEEARANVGEAVPTEEAEEECRLYCEQAVGCAWEDDQADCETDCLRFAEGARSDLFRSLVDCIDGLACTESRSLCLERAALDFGPQPVHTDFAARCEDEMSTCEPPERVESGCDPERIAFLNDDAVGELLACLEGACSAIYDCVQAVREQYAFQIF